MQGWARARKIPLALSPAAIQAFLNAYERTEADLFILALLLRRCR